MGTDTNNLKLGIKRGTKMIIFITILILLMGMTGLTAYLFYIEEKKVKKQQTEIYLAALQDLYKTLSHSVESARKYRHDLAKHINTLERLRTKTENEVLDALLTIKGKECMEKNIPFYIEIGNRDVGKIQEMDMVSLFYNLLDNAMEANEKIKEGERGIWLFIDNQEGELQIEVRNYIVGNQIPDFRTKKRNRKEHGLGMEIIMDVIKKYNGKREIKMDGKILIQQISMTVRRA